ncbi:MAG: hypothetical protein LCH51_02715 [Bacteroidetes bacterium]|nr:hypothetical protein [Bacteroidota bacterium]
MWRRSNIDFWTIWLVTVALFLFGHVPTVHAQNIEARYSIKEKIFLPLDEKTTKEFVLEYEGFVYKSGAKVISFWKPLYLALYPRGMIEYREADFASNYLLMMDTMQRVNLYHTDSLRRWGFWGTVMGAQDFTTLKYKKLRSGWKLLPETRMINGLECKHALDLFGEKVISDLWYYPGVELGFGLLGEFNVPGIIVAYTSETSNTSYHLTELKIDEPIDPSVFWPAIFKKAKFVDENQSTKPSASDTKKSAIMSQP